MTPDRAKNRSGGSPRAKKRHPDVIKAACCGAWWTGLGAAHCSGCHETFTSVSAFDRHRFRGRCIPPAEVRTRKGEIALVPASRLWSGWSTPGTWRGPQQDDEDDE